MTIKNQTITPDPGSVVLNGQSLVLFEGLEPQPGSHFFEYMLTFLVATAGLTPVYDATHYPDFTKDTTGVYEGRLSGRLLANLWRAVESTRSGKLPVNSAVTSLCCMLANAVKIACASASKPSPKSPDVSDFRNAPNTKAPSESS